MPAKRICLLAVIALSVFTVIVCARPFWCPDLTGNNFVNFPDFAVQANYWRQTGAGLPGDFWFNNAVDINDVAYLVLWWLQDCNDPPAGFCPDCNYPDCNVMDCNAPMPPYLCGLCNTTPPFIKVTITGTHGCGCTCLEDFTGSVYTDPNYSIDGNYLVPYIGYCTWESIYNHSIIKIKGYYNGPCCFYDTDPEDIATRYDKLKIIVYYYDSSTIIVDVYLWNIYFQQWERIWAYGYYTSISNPINCVEGSGNILECLDTDTSTNIGNGNITITIPP